MSMILKHLVQLFRTKQILIGKLTLKNIILIKTYIMSKRFQIKDLLIIVMDKEKFKIKEFMMKINSLVQEMRLIMNLTFIKMIIITQQKYIINKLMT